MGMGAQKNDSTAVPTIDPSAREYLLRTTPEDANFRPAAPRYLQERAIDDDVAAARGYRYLTQGAVYSEDDDLLRSVGIPDRYFRDGGTALLIPLWSIDDQDEPVSSQVRLESPEVIRKDGLRFKTPAGAERGDKKHHLPADVNPISTNVEAVLDVERPIIITEGAAKADSMIGALRREGKNGRQDAGVVSLTGVGMAVLTGTDGDGDRLHPKTLGRRRWLDLLRDRDIVIAYDGDYAEKTQVAESLRRLAICLEAVGVKRVRIIDLAGIEDDTLPERLRGQKIGVDDYLRGVEETGGSITPMRDLLRSTKAWKTVEKGLVKSETLRLRATPLPLGGIDLSSALEEWLRDAPEDAQEGVTWARDEAGNAFIRATTEDAQEWLGSWRLSVEQAIAHFITEGDRKEAQRLVATLERSDLDTASELLASGYQAIVEDLGLAPSKALDVRGEMTLRAALESVRSGGAGISIPLHEEYARGGTLRLTAEISARSDQHGLWETASFPDVPAVRRRVLPYVLAKWGLRQYLKATESMATVLDPESTRFVSAAIFHGGRVETADTLDARGDDDPVALVRALKGQGVLIGEPVSFAERDAAKRSLIQVGGDEREVYRAIHRMGWARVDGKHVWASTRGAVGANGIRDDVTAQVSPDPESNLSLSAYAQSVGYARVAEGEELLAWPDLVNNFLDLSDDKITIPTLGQFLYAALPLPPEARRTVTLTLAAEPGSAKSALLARCLHMQSATSYGGVKTFAVDVDSEPEARRKLHFFGHQLVLADDYRPSTKNRDSAKSQEALFSMLVTSAFDRAIPGRFGVDSEQFLGAIAVGAETLSGTDPSRLQRQYIVDVRKHDIKLSDLDAFSDGWTRGRNDGRANALLAAGIRLWAQALDEDSIDPKIGTAPLFRFEDGVKRRLDFGSTRPELGVVQVLSGLALWIITMEAATREAFEGRELPDGWEEYADKVAALFAEFVHAEKGDKLATSLLGQQRDSQGETEIGAMLAAAIAEGIASGDYYLAGCDGQTPADADRFGYRTREDAHGKLIWEPHPKGMLLGRVSRDGDKALILVRPLDEVRKREGISLRKSELRDRLSRVLAKGYEGKGGENISGLTTDASGRVRPMRGFVFDLATFGIDPIDDDSRSEPKQRHERRRRDDEEQF